MCEHKHDSETRREKMHRFLAISDHTLANKYPTSSKLYLSKFYGVPIQPVSRISNDAFNDKDVLSLEAVKLIMEELCSELDITPVSPT